MSQYLRETPQRITVLLPDLRGGGAERMHVDMAKVWLEQGFAVDFVLLKKQGELLPLLPEAVSVVDLGAKRYRSALFPLLRYLRATKPDVLLAAMWPITVIAIVARWISRQKTRVIVSDHNTLSNSYADRGILHRLFLRLSMRMAYPFADVRIAVSKGVATDLSCLSGLNESCFTVIYNPAAKQNNVPQHEDRPEGLIPDAKILLSVGTLKYQKNHELLIKAFSKIPAHMNTQLCILGEGVLRPQLEELVRISNLEGRVFMPGFCTHPSTYYNAADLFVLSSHYEGFGNVIVEALECGIPVVSTDCPSGPSEILCDGKYGRLVPTGDVDALASAMISALQDTHDHNALKLRALDFSVEKISNEYLNAMFPSNN
ncbi:glycosyltransferase [Pseudomonas fluorescens]|uniref:Glycosyltransferase Gtf1 n=1 Tax=Pseudomonas fluorescens TaxID=294 RepID=A0A5E7VT33_PSEFL|nr:glycosyltransferase [Pseudomonas fluorescens]VVQ26011.1 Glycosyltransferase Gtf1 [Pseudomonas fluorescens]